MERGYLDFDLALVADGAGAVAHATSSVGTASAPFTLPFGAVELAQFLTAVGPPRVTSRRLVPAPARVASVKDYGERLGAAALTGDVDQLFRSSLSMAKRDGVDLRVRLRLAGAPELQAVPWEYLYDARLGRFLTLSVRTPVVRVVDALDEPGPVSVEPPLQVLVMISSPSDLPALDVEHEKQLLLATTSDLVESGRLEFTFLTNATLSNLQRALLDTVHVFHFIGHGGFNDASGLGVLALERDDGTADLVSGSRLGTLFHDARYLQLAVLNACEGARTSGNDAFSGVAQALVRQGLPAVVAMQTEISDRAAIVFSHEFYSYLTRDLPIDAAICEVRKAMAVSDEASEWGTAVLLRSGTSQPFDMAVLDQQAAPVQEQRWKSLYDAAQESLVSRTPEAAMPFLEQLAAERPDFGDVTTLLERVQTQSLARIPETPPQGEATAETESLAETDAETAAQAPTVEPMPVATLFSPARPDGSEPEPAIEPEPYDEPEPEDEPQLEPEPVPTRPVPRSRRSRRASGGVKPGTIVRLVIIAALLLGGWAAWRVLPSLLQRAGPALEIACGSAPQTPAPSTDALIGCATVAPTIDGEFDDWRSIPTHEVSHVVDARGGVQSGFTSTWQLLWDKDALFLRAAVRDRQLIAVNEAAPASFWSGDGVSFEFGPDPSGLSTSAKVRQGKDFHVLLGLTADGDRGARAAINKSNRGTFVAGGFTPEIDVARRLTSDGYQLEARVPWAQLGLTIPPARGTVVGMNVNVSDARSTGALRAMISSNPQRTAQVQNRPALWRTVTLGDQE